MDETLEFVLPLLELRRRVQQIDVILKYHFAGILEDCRTLKNPIREIHGAGGRSGGDLGEIIYTTGKEMIWAVG